jgi:phage terminase large subunit
LLEIKRHNNKIYVNELLYKRGLTNQAISRELELLGISKSAEIIADREPKSIEELVIEGWNVIGADKGPGSVRTGVNYLLAQEIYYTESSSNLALESQNYKWALDRNKLPTNEPIDDWNHAIDSLRYCVVRKTTFVGFI